jgi:hypothetical protein
MHTAWSLCAVASFIGAWAPSGAYAAQRWANSVDLMTADSYLDRSFVLAPSGRFVLFFAKGSKFASLPDWKVYGFDALNGDDDEDLTGRYWSWWYSNEFAQVALSPTGSKLVSPVTVNGKPQIALADMESRRAAEVLVGIPKDFWGIRALAWTGNGSGVYLQLSYRLQRPRARPEDDNPVTENLNVALRVSGRYEPKRSSSQIVPAAYPGAVAQGQRDFIVFYDFKNHVLRRVLSGNDINFIEFSPDQRRVLISQRELGLKNGVQLDTADVYLVALPPTEDLPPIDLMKAKEAERNAGWFDHQGRRIDPILRDLAAVQPATPFYKPTWSPDGARFAFAGATERSSMLNVWLYDVHKKNLVNLTAGAEVAQAVGKSPWRVPQEPNSGNPDFSFWNGPLWTADARRVLVTTNRGQLWSIPTDGESAPVDRTPAQGPGIVRLLGQVGRKGMAFARDSKVLVETTDVETMTDGVAWFDLEQGHLDPVYGGKGQIGHAMVFSGADRLLFSETPPDGTAQFADLPLAERSLPRQISDFESSLSGFSWPQKRLLRFMTAGGSVGYARLQMPPGAEQGTRRPLIIIPQLDSSVLLPWRALGRDINHPSGEPLEQWTDHGYAVLVFDVPLNPPGSQFVDPLKLAAEACDAATDAAVATGLVDPAKLALFGDRRRGYIVQGLIGRLDRFQAAISVGSPGDLTAYALLGYESEVRSNLWMDVGFIDNPSRYLESSPITYFKKVRTPLLLIDSDGGGGPGANPFAEESFSALLPTGTPVVRALYNKSIGDDVQRRIFLWLDEHLNGGPVNSGLATLPEAPAPGSTASSPPTQ